MLIYCQLVRSSSSIQLQMWLFGYDLLVGSLKNRFEGRLACQLRLPRFMGLPYDQTNVETLQRLRATLQKVITNCEAKGQMARELHQQLIAANCLIYELPNPQSPFEKETFCR